MQNDDIGTGVKERDEECEELEYRNEKEDKTTPLTAQSIKFDEQI